MQLIIHLYLLVIRGGTEYMNLKDLKQEISKEAIEGYKVKTNFSSCEFLVEVGNITIMAKPICLEKEVRYEFMLDTQWLSSNEVTYKEIVMIKKYHGYIK